MTPAGHTAQIDVSLTDDGELVLFAAGGKEYKEIGRAKICESNWCSPAYVDGRLYLRDGIKATGNLFCVQLLP